MIYVHLLIKELLHKRFISIYPKHSTACGTAACYENWKPSASEGNNWFRDYLSCRMQATVIKGEKSDFKSVSAGVSQGSVIGPLLFLIYINDIVNIIESVIKLFADDTSLSLALNHLDSRAEILNHDLEKKKSMNGP